MKSVYNNEENEEIKIMEKNLSPQDRKAVTILPDGTYLTGLENAFCEKLAAKEYIDLKNFRKEAVAVYRALRPGASQATIEVNARKLLKMPKIIDRIELFRLVIGKSEKTLLSEREEINQKVNKIVLNALDQEINRMTKGEMFDPKSSFLAGGRLMAINVWLTEHQRAYGMHPTTKESAQKTEQNLILISPDSTIKSTYNKAIEHLNNLNKQGFITDTEKKNTATVVVDDGEIVDNSI